MRDTRPEQSPNADFSIFVTLLGIVRDVSLLQLEQAYSPILVTLLGITKEVRP